MYGAQLKGGSARKQRRRVGHDRQSQSSRGPLSVRLERLEPTLSLLPSLQVLPCSSRLLPRPPYADQTAHCARQPNDPIIKVCIAQRSTRDGQVTQVRNKLDVRSSPFPKQTRQYPRTSTNASRNVPLDL